MNTQVCECGAQSRRLRVFSEQRVVRVRWICQDCYADTDQPQAGDVTDLTIRDLVWCLRQLEHTVSKE